MPKKYCKALPAVGSGTLVLYDQFEINSMGGRTGREEAEDFAKKNNINPDVFAHSFEGDYRGKPYDGTIAIIAHSNGKTIRTRGGKNKVRLTPPQLKSELSSKGYNPSRVLLLCCDVADDFGELLFQQYNENIDVFAANAPLSIDIHGNVSVGRPLLAYGDKPSLCDTMNLAFIISALTCCFCCPSHYHNSSFSHWYPAIDQLQKVHIV